MVCVYKVSCGFSVVGCESCVCYAFRNDVYAFRNWVNLICFYGLMGLLCNCLNFFLFWPLCVLLGERSSFDVFFGVFGLFWFSFFVFLFIYLPIYFLFYFIFWLAVIYLLDCWKFGHSSRCGGFPFHCWLDCFANFVKIFVR